MHHDNDDHDGGLQHDLQTLLSQSQRRQALRLLGAGTLLGLAGAARAATCSLIPEETAGPYPGDGSNALQGHTINALTLAGIVRSDIRSSVAGASGTAAGLPATLRIQLVNTNGGCASLAGYAIYVWHCTRDGLYSMYNSGVTGENFLRGVQITDASGGVAFRTIFPGCYAGRMPHIHFEVYRNANTALSYTNKLRTSQIAIPDNFCRRVYRSNDGYGQSVINLGQMSFATDNVFNDGYETQLASAVMTRTEGAALELQVGISA